MNYVRDKYYIICLLYRKRVDARIVMCIIQCLGSNTITAPYTASFISR